MEQQRRRRLWTEILVTITLAALLNSCVVTSVAPYFSEADLFFEPALVGEWTRLGRVGEEEDDASSLHEFDKGQIWKFEAQGNRNYRFTLISGGKATVMEVHAFKLQGQLFLDLASTESDFHVIPPHYLLKVVQLVPDLRLSVLDNDWLWDLLSSNPEAVAHHLVGGRVVLTAGTAALQAFVRNYLKTPEAWYELRLKRASGVPQKLVEEPAPSPPSPPPPSPPAPPPPPPLAAPEKKDPPARHLTRDELTKRVLGLVTEQLGVDSQEVSLDASWTGLGADSLDFVELQMAMEEEFGLEITDRDMEKLTTVGDAIDFLYKKIMEDSAK